MPTPSGFQEKVDVLDMIIGILREHEENLSRLADRFDNLCNDLANVEEKISMLDQSLERLNGIRVGSVIETSGLRGPLATIKCKNWLTFRGVSQGALLVAFEIEDGLLSVSSISDLFIFTYFENLPNLEMLLNGGEEKMFRGHPLNSNLRAPSLEDGDAVYEAIFKPEMIKRWLSLELGIPEEKVIEGRIIG